MTAPAGGGDTPLEDRILYLEQCFSEVFATTTNVESNKNALTAHDDMIKTLQNQIVLLVEQVVAMRGDVDTLQSKMEAEPWIHSRRSPTPSEPRTDSRPFVHDTYTVHRGPPPALPENAAVTTSPSFTSPVPPLPSIAPAQNSTVAPQQSPRTSEAPSQAHSQAHSLNDNPNKDTFSAFNAKEAYVTILQHTADVAEVCGLIETLSKRLDKEIYESAASQIMAFKSAIQSEVVNQLRNPRVKDQAERNLKANENISNLPEVKGPTEVDIDKAQEAPGAAKIAVDVLARQVNLLARQLDTLKSEVHGMDLQRIVVI